ncbi:MAG: methionyl-tRNA formyltransferase [Actinobacteria bacterium]|nr:methionyl-tRNA formyltransferase [Actinomycetota bacterium]
MALIKKEMLTKISKNRNSVHKTTIGTYTIFTNAKEKYFQIDTYGSDDRVMKEKVSQSIQIDRETTKFLIEILKKEFALD